MKGYLGILFLPVLIMSVLISLSYIRDLKNLIKKLKDDHALVWINLGRPSLDGTLSAFNAFSTIKFLIKKDYLIMNDTELSKLGSKARIKFLIFSILLLLALLIPIFGKLL